MKTPAAIADRCRNRIRRPLANGIQGRKLQLSDAEIRQSFTLANSPQHLAKLGLIVPVLRQRLFASIDGQYTSPAQTLAGNTLSGFPVLNFTLLGHTLGKHPDLSGSVYNLFNKKYFDPGRPEDSRTRFNRTEETFGSNSRTGFEGCGFFWAKTEIRACADHPWRGRRIGLAVLAISLVALDSMAQAQQSNATEDQVKAAYLLNFAKLAEWPQTALPNGPSPLTIGVSGGDENFLRVLRALVAGNLWNSPPRGQSCCLH